MFVYYQIINVQENKKKNRKEKKGTYLTHNEKFGSEYNKHLNYKCWPWKQADQTFNFDWMGSMTSPS